MKNFYNGRKVFITGHTGFKGSWLCMFLSYLGADVTGYALEPQEKLNLFNLSRIEKNINSVYGDIRDFQLLKSDLIESGAEVVIHLAAQPLVRESYDNPAYTYDVNVMGTVNLLEAVRRCNTVRTVINVTTDKVYENAESQEGYAEEDRLDGYDPYANSKSCSELVTASYRRSFFSNDIQEKRKVAISTARAGNVIGGGDFANNRIIPDCAKTALGLNKEKRVLVRNPNSIRPYQHVLEPLVAYLKIASSQYKDNTYIGTYNIGPKEEDCITTKQLVEMFCNEWGEGLTWKVQQKNYLQEQKHEAGFLRLNSNKINQMLGYQPRWNIEKAIQKSVEWYKCYKDNQNIRECMERQIKEFISEGR